MLSPPQRRSAGTPFLLWRYRYFICSLLLFMVLVLATFFLFFRVEPVEVDKRNACNNNNPPAKIAIVGDLLIGSGKVWKQIVLDNYSGAIVGQYLNIMQRSDIVFANFEGAISEEGEARSKNLPAQFSLRTNPAVIRFLENFGTVVLSFANNHSADYGEYGIENTISLLESNDNIDYVGIGRNREEALTPIIEEVSGVRIAFLAFTDLLPREYYATHNNPGIAQLTSANLQQAIKQTKQFSDFIIVSLHTAEDIAVPYSFEPDSHQKFYFRLAVEYGADMVVGQHPHGLQVSEKYQDKFIFYSLGLFLYNPAVSKRYAPEHPLFEATQFKGGGVLKLEVCREGILDFELMPTKVVEYEQRLMVVSANSIDGPQSVSTLLQSFFLYFSEIVEAIKYWIYDEK